jgi:NAD-dependent deacetylase sirtuin 4
VVLTGAGCSTDSGIPDYRGNGRPTTHSPIQHDAFVRRPEVRQRYWARATLGWGRFSQALPNSGHGALADMERSGLVRGIITQNVDRLHQAAGSVRVVELHGALAEVRCLACGAREDRSALQSRLLAANPEWLDHAGAVAPDGDADLSGHLIAGFRIPDCLACGGVLMPDVVFFGGRVSDDKVAAAWALLDEAEVLLVVGSSLAVYSGWRFVRGAAERGIPVAIVNIGRTRADEISRVRIAAPAGTLLPRLAAHLQRPPHGYPDGAQPTPQAGGGVV